MSEQLNFEVKQKYVDLIRCHVLWAKAISTGSWWKARFKSRCVHLMGMRHEISFWTDLTSVPKDKVTKLHCSALKGIFLLLKGYHFWSLMLCIIKFSLLQILLFSGYFPSREVNLANNFFVELLMSAVIYFETWWRKGKTLRQEIEQ